VRVESDDAMLSYHIVSSHLTWLVLTCFCSFQRH